MTHKQGGRPWRVGVPFLLGGLIALVMGVSQGRAGFLFLAALVWVWGGLWVWGALRERRGAGRIARCPRYTSPQPGEAVVLGAASWHGKGILLSTADELFWVKAGAVPGASPGHSIALRDVREDVLNTVARLDEIDGYCLKAGVFGGDTLLLRLSGGRTVTMRLSDPEIWPLLNAARTCRVPLYNPKATE